MEGINQTTPHDVLIGDGDPKGIQQRYEHHRTKRNSDQRHRLLSGQLKSLDIDPTLYKLLHSEKYPDFSDERHCLVIWARPPLALRKLVVEIQNRLKDVAPNLWTLPPENLHMTVMEVTHSLTAPEIANLVSKISPKLEELTDYTFAHRARIIKPLVCFDASALALSFLPAAHENEPSAHDDLYTYHHLRRDLFRLLRSTGVNVASRYVLPSAHLTVARFVTNADHSSSPESSDDPGGDGILDTEKIERWLKAIDEINTWLVETCWPKVEDDNILPGSQWLVGEERGLDCKAGTIWYGKDTEDTVRIGKGF